MTNSKVTHTYELFLELNEKLKKSKSNSEIMQIEELIDKMSTYLTISTLFAQILVKCTNEFISATEETNTVVMDYFAQRLQHLRNEKEDEGWYESEDGS